MSQFSFLFGPDLQATAAVLEKQAPGLVSSFTSGILVEGSFDFGRRVPHPKE